MLQEIANQKGVSCRAQGWKVHLCAAQLLQLVGDATAGRSSRRTLERCWPSGAVPQTEPQRSSMGAREAVRGRGAFSACRASRLSPRHRMVPQHTLPLSLTGAGRVHRGLGSREAGHVPPLRHGNQGLCCHVALGGARVLSDGQCK